MDQDAQRAFTPGLMILSVVPGNSVVFFEGLNYTH